VEIADLTRSYRTKGILIDSNLLVLLLVGLYRPDRIQTHKRTDKYTVADFVIVKQFAEAFARRITTPHLLTEVNSLSRQLPNKEHDALALISAHLFTAQLEIYVPSAEAVRHSRFPMLGLTDCTTIIAAQQEDVLVLTDEYELTGIMDHLGLAVINLNHLRSHDLLGS
jgi:hypothetical protein